MGSLGRFMACVIITLYASGAVFGQVIDSEIVIDDFESSEVGEIPRLWWGLQGRKVIPLSPTMKESGEYYAVQRDERGQFLRVGTINESLRIVMPNSRGFEWNLETHPFISWKWRPNILPTNAREDRINDSAGSVYVTFGFDWLRRPRSIKYTYSTTLPVGTVVDQGTLIIVVVSSGSDGLGRWQQIKRNVADDHRTFFGREASPKPVSIAIWSDSDTTETQSEMDFDDLKLLSEN